MTLEELTKEFLEHTDDIGNYEVKCRKISPEGKNPEQDIKDWVVDETCIWLEY